MRRWRTFRQLGPFERRIVLEAACGLLASWVGLRLAGFRRWQRVLAFFGPPPKTTGPARGASDEEFARVITRMEAAAARNIFARANCLEQSVVLWWLLRRNGINAVLRIGGRKESGQFEAHAWVELDGWVLDGSSQEHRHFVPFESPVLSMESRTK
ncbi:MAG: lasso peptide biosynthesis B2 protein [Candidatus Acidiferrales bacterium]